MGNITYTFVYGKYDFWLARESMYIKTCFHPYSVAATRSIFLIAPVF